MNFNLFRYCELNKWDPARASCQAPEETISSVQSKSNRDNLRGRGKGRGRGSRGGRSRVSETKRVKRAKNKPSYIHCDKCKKKRALSPSVSFNSLSAFW